MVDNKDNEFRLTITQDKLVDILMHAATREDIAKLDTKFNEKFDKIDEKFNKIDERFNKIDEKFDKIDEKFDKIDEKFDKSDERFMRMEDKLSRIDEKFDAKYDKIMWGIVLAILIPVATQILSHLIK